ncbi:MAG: hypothetical protein H8E30_03215 [Alphaproteobacteria bacterium]|nr:hypothetical protein [Alphaproteobacteria bacterium]
MSEAEAIAEWEAKNEPIGNREPVIVALRFISPSDKATSEGKDFRDAIKEPT